MESKVNYEIIEKLFREKYRYFSTIAWRIVKDSILADDIVQDSFFHILKWHGLIISPRHCTILLAKIIKQRAYNYFKHEAMYNKHIILFGSVIEYMQPPISKHIDNYPLINNIIKKIPTLPTAQCKVINLYLNDLSIKEISEESGISQSHVSNTAKNGFRNLRFLSYKSHMEEVHQKASKNALAANPLHKRGREVMKFIREEGGSYDQAAEKFEVPKRTIQMLYNRHLVKEGNSKADQFQKRWTRTIGLITMKMRLIDIAEAVRVTVSAVSILKKRAEENNYQGRYKIPDINSDPWYKETFEKFAKETVNKANTKMTTEQVREIKILLKKKKFKDREIAEKMSVSLGTVKNIKSGNSWSHIAI